MKIFIASDHAGFQLKTHFLRELPNLVSGLEFIDLGPGDEKSVDYPDYSKKLCERLLTEIVSNQGEVQGPGQGVGQRVGQGANSSAGQSFDQGSSLATSKAAGLNSPGGILICGSGQGMAISANRNKGIRAALCWDLPSAKLSRLHNNANVLCLGSRLIPYGYALEIAKIWLTTPFEVGRHQHRLDKF